MVVRRQNTLPINSITNSTNCRHINYQPCCHEHHTLYGISLWSMFYPLIVVFFRCSSQSHIPLISPCVLSSATFSSMHAWIITWRPSCLTPFLSQCSAISSTGCQGQRAGSVELECSRVCLWVDGRQSVACLHFIYHSPGAVNLYRCLSMTMSLLVGLHLLFSLSLSSCPALCVSM